MKSLFSSKVSIVLLSISLSLAILLGFSLQANLSIERPIKIIDLSTLTQDEVLAWATDNQLTINTQDAYDENIPAGTILSQDVNVGERLFAGSSITITVSKGPDPEVLVNLVDFSGKDIGDVQTFIDANKLMNAKIEFEKSTKINSAFFIRQSIASGQIKRSDAISFYISTGDKDTLTTVVVPDFSTYTKQQISSWGSSSNIKINFIEEFNSSVEAGKVYEQSLAANAEVYDGSSITIKLSKGTGVVLENLVGKSKGEIDSFVKSNGLTVTYTYTYSGAQAKDIATTMSPSATTRVANGSAVNVTLSLGKVTIKDFTGKTLKELEAWIAEVNKQGAGLKASSSSVYSESVSAGNLIKQTPSSGETSPGSTITASVSKGLGVTVKDFNTRSDTQDGLTISIQEKYSTSASGTVLSQSIAAGTLVDRGTGITLTVSVGNVPVSSKVGSSLSDLQAWINSVNGMGANLSLSTSEAYNDASKGTVISQSPSSGSIAPGSTISASISKYKSVTLGNLVGSAVPSISGISFNNVGKEYNSTYASGIVIWQSKGAGTYDYGLTVDIKVSDGPEPVRTVPQLSYISQISSSETTTRNYIVEAFKNSPGVNYSIVVGNYSKGCGDIHDIQPREGDSVASSQTVVVQIQEQSTCSQ